MYIPGTSWLWTKLLILCRSQPESRSQKLACTDMSVCWSAGLALASVAMFYTFTGDVVGRKSLHAFPDMIPLLQKTIMMIFQVTNICRFPCCKVLFLKLPLLSKISMQKWRSLWKMEIFSLIGCCGKSGPSSRKWDLWMKSWIILFSNEG